MHIPVHNMPDIYKIGQVDKENKVVTINICIMKQLTNTFDYQAQRF